ncbi:MAG: hypothetical protein HY293_10310, partial [Planctomycetes bacterium]|nr:hypothetical protein [Planctomycetota bacterium]
GFTRPDLSQCDRWLLILSALVALRLLAQVWFFAPYLGDTLSYHLPKIAEWVRAGAFTRELGPDPRSAFPAGFELIETWWVVFLHHDALIEMAGVEFLAVSAAAAFAMAREFGWSVRSASLAAFLTALTPGLHLQATSCLNDGPVAALVLSTAALIAAKASPLLLLIPVGLGAGVKPTFVYAMPGLAVIALLFRRERSGLLPSPRTAAAVAAGALAVGATWYLRNWLVYGSPIHPMGSEGMKSLATGSTLQQLGPSLSGFRENLACFLDIRVYDRRFPADSLGAGNFNWGAVAFAIGAPALIPLLREEAPLRRVAIGLTVSLLTLFALVQLDLWYARFVLFFAVLPVLAVARLWERQKLVAFLGSLALAAELLATFAPASLPRESLRRMQREGVASRASTPVPAAADAVGYVSGDFNGAYSLYGPGCSRRVVYLRDETIDGLLGHLRSEGLKIFYVSEGLRTRQAMLDDAVRRGRLSPFKEGDWKGYQVLP